MGPIVAPNAGSSSQWPGSHHYAHVHSSLQSSSSSSRD